MQIAKKATLIYRLRRRKSEYKQEDFIVYGRITISGIRREFSTGLETREIDWSVDSYKFTGQDSFEKNGELHQITKRIKEICLRFELNKKRYTASQVMKVYKTDEDIIDYHSINTCYNEYINFQNRRVLANEISKGFCYLLERIHRLHFSPFWKDNGIEVLEEIKPYHFKELLLHFQADRGFSRNWTRKMIMYYKNFLDFCVEREWLESNPFRNGKLPPKEKKKIEYVPFDEVKILEDYSFASNPLEKTKDAFLFCCYTGLAYADYSKLTSKNISTEKDGREWITLQRSKGEAKDYGYTKVPILEGAKRLIEKYEGIDNLPKMTNQRFNLYLKEVGNILDLSIELRFHTARKTFAMIALNEWQLPVEVVAKLLGHSSPKTTLEAYAFVQDNTVVNAMSGIM